jgi:hypothetical protein
MIQTSTAGYLPKEGDLEATQNTNPQQVAGTLNSPE